MNTRIGLKRWIGMGLLVGLVALLATVSVQAEAVDELVRPAYGIVAVHCDIELFDEGDPFMSFAEADVPCEDLIASEIRSIEFTGNVAWARVVVGDETELHVYRKNGGVWERFPYSPQSGSEYLYIIEQENLSLGLVDPVSQPAASRDITWSNETWASQGEAWDEYWAELEDLGAGVEPAAQPEAAPRDVSSDPRGISYWEQFFAGQGTTAGPSAASTSADEAGSIDWREREIDLASGSKLNTMADLVLSLFDRAWAENAASEDLSREIE